ncbi:MAG: hypothetical protein ACKVHP_09150, partial [Verrucomicrobiales bacterium]
KDASKFPDRLEGSPLGKIWKDAKIQKFIAPALEAFNEELLQNDAAEPTMKAMKDALRAFQGETVLSLNSLPFDAVMVGMQGGGNEMAILESVEKGLSVTALGKVAADGKAFSEKWGALMEMGKEELNKQEGGPKAEVFRETVDGNEITTLRLTLPKAEKQFDSLTIARVGDVGIVGMPRKAVEQSIATMKNGVKGAKITSGSFGTFHKRYAENDMHMHLNIVPWVKNGMAIAKQVGADQMMGQQAAGMGVSVQSIHDALGLGDLLSMDWAIEFDSESPVIGGGIQFTKRSGLMNLLAYVPGPLPKTSFIPRDVPSASVSMFSLANVWKGVMDILQTAAPGMAPMVKQQLGMVEGQLGISIEKDLLGNLKPELIMVQSTTAADGEAHQDDRLFMLGLKNEQGFEVAFDKVLAFAAGMTGMAFEPSEFLGQKMHTLETPGGAAMKISYLFGKGYMMLSVGKGEALRKVLSNMERPGKALWEEARVKNALAKFDAGYSEISYVDLASTLSNLGGALSGMIPDGEAPVDWDHFPTLAEWKNLIGFVVSASYMEKNGFFGKAMLLPDAK